jgi:predicted Holliday junction resolvase-like endonuclease
MTGHLGRTFADLGDVLGVCPCCAELFYLSEVRPYFAGKQPHSVVDRLRAAEDRLAREEERLSEIEDALREKAAMAGLKTAKKLLKKIDPVFSGAGYDPHDVKVIFDPVTYVVFNGMSERKLRDIVLLAKPPETSTTERLHKSITKAISSGNIEFKTLHVGEDGMVAPR